MFLEELKNKICWAILVGLLVTQQSLAADISHTMQREKNSEFTRVLIKVDGIIQKGDAEKIRSIMETPSQTILADDLDAVASFNSLGGSLSEAIRLIDMFREFGVSTYVGEGANCLSACAVAFMGGVNVVYQERFIDRVLHPKARLGFHAPSLAIDPSLSVKGSQVSKAFDVALKSMAELVFRKDRLNIPDNLISTMLETNPSDMYILTKVAEVNAWDIDLDISSENWVPNTKDIIQLCGHYKGWQSGHFKDMEFYRSEYNSKYEPLSERETWNPSNTLITETWDNITLYSTIYNDFDGLSMQCYVHHSIENPDTMHIRYSSESRSAVIEGIKTTGVWNIPAHRQHTFDPHKDLQDINLPSYRLKFENTNDPTREFIGYCRIFNQGRQTDATLCSRTQEFAIYTFQWPSGALTVVDYQQDRPTINGSAMATTRAPDGEGLCYKNLGSGNEFCFSER